MQVSVRDGMLGVMGKSDPSEALAALGLASVELAVNKEGKVTWIAPDGQDSFDVTSASDVAALKAALAEQKSEACALLMANDFTSDSYDDEVAMLVATCEAAEGMGVPAVRVDMVMRKEGLEEDEFVGLCAGAVKSALGATSNVRIGVENHGGTSNRPELLDKVFGATGDMRFGLTLDSGNFYWYGHPLDKVYQIMEKYAARIYHTHIKNIAYPEEIRNTQREMGFEYGKYVCPIYEGDVDHARFVTILKGAGYTGTLCVEDESLGKFSPDQKQDVLRKDVAYLKSLL